MQPVFLLLFIKYTVFPDSESYQDSESESYNPLPPGMIFFEAGAVARRLQHAPPSWGRAEWLKYSAALAVFCISLALLYICVINPSLLMLYCVVQPLLIFVTVKWMTISDTAASLHHRRIRLEPVAFDAALFNDVDLPRSCAICLCDFDGVSEPTDSVYRSRSHTQNVVLVEGAGAAGWRQGDIVRLPCARAHCFHAGCIHGWLTAYGTCPICRSRSGEELPRWWIVRQWCTQLLTTTPALD
jgi:hypothetical protein